jgi:hypothetical protein
MSILFEKAMNFYYELNVEELLFDNKNSCGCRRF